MRCAVGILASFFVAGCGLSSEGLSSSSSSTGTTTETSTGTGGEGTTTTTGAGGDGGAGATGGAGGAAPECAAGEDCIAAAGGGQYVVVIDGTACPSGWEAVAPYSATNQDPGCTACTCGPPAGSCTPGDAYAFDAISGNTCASPMQAFDNPSDGACLDVDNSSSGKDAFGEFAPTATSGSCTPSGASPVAVVTQTVCVTAAEPAACSTGSCVPVPDTGAVCVLVAAADPCPPGWPQATSVFSLQSDDRTCGCSCEKAPSGTCAGAGVDAFTNSSCSGAPTVSVPADGFCHDPVNIGNVQSMLVHAGTWTEAGGCAVQPLSGGSVVFGPEMHVCCAQ